MEDSFTTGLSACPASVNLQFITHFTDKYSYIDSAIMALEGGCRWIQLRMKDADESEIERTALKLIPECRRKGAVFVIDDHVELALRVGADGVHLGKTICLWTRHVSLQAKISLSEVRQTHLKMLAAWLPRVLII